MGFRTKLSEYAPFLFSLFFCFIAAYCKQTHPITRTHPTSTTTQPLIHTPPRACPVDGVMQVLAERRAQQIRNLPPLPDLGHSVLPYIHWYKLNDVYIALFAAAFVLRFAPYPGLRLKVLRRFLFLEGVILLFRGISVVLTTLSIPLQNCVSDALGNPLIESFYIFIYVHHTCADLVRTHSGPHSRAFCLST